MITRLAIVGLLLVGACNGSRRSSVDSGSAASTKRAALRAGTPPGVPTPFAIENLDAVPTEARGRLESTVLAIVENRATDFVDTVSTGGFTIGSLALTKDQAQAELAGRTVAELTNVACATVDACRWTVSARGAKQIELEAHANGALVGAVALVHEDDGSWGVAGAREITASRDPGPIGSFGRSPKSL